MASGVTNDYILTLAHYLPSTLPLTHSKQSTPYSLGIVDQQGRLGEVTLLDVRGRVGKAPKDKTGYVRTVYEGLRSDFQVRPSAHACGQVRPRHSISPKQDACLY